MAHCKVDKLMKTKDGLLETEDNIKPDHFFSLRLFAYNDMSSN